MALSMSPICISTTSSVTAMADLSGVEMETLQAASKKARSGWLRVEELYAQYSVMAVVAGMSMPRLSLMRRSLTRTVSWYSWVRLFIL